MVLWIRLSLFFSVTDVREWSEHEWCRNWTLLQGKHLTEEVKALMLPTLLEGEAIAVWLELSEDEQADYTVVKDKQVSSPRFCLSWRLSAAKTTPGWTTVRVCPRLKETPRPSHAVPGITANLDCWWSTTVIMSYSLYLRAHWERDCLELKPWQRQ